MAKGDDKRARNQIDRQETRAQDQINVTQGNLVPQNQQAQNLFTQAANQQMGDYGDIMGQYKNFASSVPQNVTAQNVSYSRDPSISQALSGFGEFARTGGYSDQDQIELRARGVSPVRQVYANMMNEMQRRQNLQGGYSPNYNATANRMRAGTSQQIADQVTNVNAGLAEAIREGKLKGLTGLSETGIADSQMIQQALLANQSAALQAAGINSNNANTRLGAIQGQSNLFGTNPGLSQTFGQHVGQSNQELGDITQAQNQLGLGLTQAQIDAASIPGTWENTMGRVGDVAGIVGSVAGGFTGMGNLGKIATGIAQNV